jgi:thiamine pyrophosphate-dependent acetolactate synthase large subunit-like protein
VPPVCEAGGIAAIKPQSPAEALTDTRTAIARASAGETIVLNVTYDLLEATVPDPAALPDAAPVEAAAPPAVRTEQINVVADFLQETFAVGRPVILAGDGAVQAGAGPALQRLGELTGSLLTTSLLARGLFEGDPYDLGVTGTFSTSIGTEFLRQADVVIAVGASLNSFTTFSGHLFPQARIIQIDADAGALGRFVEVEPELAIQGDAREVAEALVAELEARGHSATGYRRQEIRERLAAFDDAKDFSDQSLPDRIDPRTLFVELDRIFPRNRTLVIDPGHHCSFASRYLQVRGPGDFVWPFEAGSIGVGVGEGIGATLGSKPGTVGIAAIGDGGLMMGLADVETAVRYEVPVVFVCSNDQGLGAEVHFLDMIGQPTELAKHTMPDLAAVAVALGAEGFTVRTVEDLEALRERFTRPVEGPILVDCWVNPAIRGEWLEIAYGSKLKPAEDAEDAVAAAEVVAAAD